MQFYKRLNYSLGNEDWSVEEQALRIRSGDRVACVTASGDRPLHLLMTDCSEVISIDMNQIQTNLLELKLSALSQLDYEKYIAFLGCEPTEHRFAIYNELKNNLSAEAAAYWDKNKKMIERGVVYQGFVERLTNVVSKVLHVIRHKKVDTLLSFSDIDSQRDYVKKEWDTLFLRELFELLLSSNISKYIINDPGLIVQEDGSIIPGQYIYQRMNQYLENNLARKSPLFQLIFTGKILPDAYFPYLTYEGYKKIRANINRLQFKTGNIIEFLNSTVPNTFDCYSMSDIASYMPQEIFEELLNGIYSSAKDNAHFCLRELMTHRKIPCHLTSKFQRDAKLEAKLEKEETNFVYRFFVGDIKK